VAGGEFVFARELTHSFGGEMQNTGGGFNVRGGSLVSLGKERISLGKK